MFEAFSDSYYIGRLYVTPGPDDPPRMQRAQVHQINDELLTAEDDTIVDLDRPLVVKLGPHHFPVHADTEVPADTLVVPTSLLEETPVENPPEFCGVLLARGERAKQLLWLTGAGRRNAVS